MWEVIDFQSAGDGQRWAYASLKTQASQRDSTLGRRSIV